MSKDHDPRGCQLCNAQNGTEEADAYDQALTDLHDGIYDFDPSRFPAASYYWLSAYRHQMETLGPGFRELAKQEASQ